MTSYSDLVAKAKKLSECLKPRQKHAPPAEIISEASDTIEGLIHNLQPYLPPTAAQKTAAKEDPVGQQIKKFIGLDARRKRFFNLAYFSGKFNSLPPDRKLVASETPTAVKSLVDAIILYYYRLGLGSDEANLQNFQIEIENDYNNDPEVRRILRMKELYRSLMILDDRQEIVARLQDQFRKEEDLKEFAKVNNLRIPAQTRGKGVAKKTLHERLAEAIYDQGSIPRIRLS